MKKIISVFILLQQLACFNAQHPKKIVALVPGHNDARYLPNCFKALACYADAIVYLDDASTDDSLAVARSLKKECNIEQIIQKEEWVRHAGLDRNILLNAGRAIGGTHFITLDADEIFTANCLENNYLKNIILNLKSGESLFMTWIQLWRSLDRYRYDSSVWTHNYKPFAFCDDGICAHASHYLNERRIPDNLQGKQWFLEGYRYGVLHFQFVNFENLLIKQAWYRCLERVLNKNRSVESINQEYFPSKNESGLATEQSPDFWFERYAFFDSEAPKKQETWRVENVMDWFEKYGLNRFAGLDIWDVKWPFEKSISEDSNFLDTFIIQKKYNSCFAVLHQTGKPFFYKDFLKTARNWTQIDVNGDYEVLCIEDDISEADITDVTKILQNNNELKVVVIQNGVLTEQVKNLCIKNGFYLVPFQEQNACFFIKCV